MKKSDKRKMIPSPRVHRPHRDATSPKTAHGSKNKDEIGAHYTKTKYQMPMLKLSLTRGNEMARE
jgi:hypothetical protein